MPIAQPDGYLAIPPTGEGSPVLVLHAWWGLNDTMKGICDRLAAARFVAFAPDLFHGKVADTIEGAEAHLKEFEGEQTSAAVAKAAEYLAERSGRSSLAVIGFSFGANYALDLSAADPDRIRQVVLFYGTGGGDWSASRASYLGHFAENDPYEPLQYVAELESDLRSAGRPVTFHRYHGAGHWFFEPDRTDAYNEEAAALAWDRTLRFLKTGVLE